MTFMKYILILFFVTKTFLSFSQKENDLGQLINDWKVVAKLDSTGNFKALKNGEFRFNFYLKLDSTVNFSEADQQHGKNMKGTWSINMTDKILRFHFTELVREGLEDYSSIPIQETRAFKISKINIYELVLTQLEDSVKRTYFLKHINL